MHDPTVILCKIDASGFAEASKGFPPAKIAAKDFMEGTATDVNGRTVIITFERHRVTRRKASWYAWLLHDARYVDEP
jgi:hypothetical protein